jgi:hypothetical protein
MGPSPVVIPADTPHSNTESSTILLTFLAQPAVKAHFHSTVGRFLSARKLLKDQERSLSKLTAACASSGLPKSMRLEIVNRTNLPTVEGHPEFFAADVAALRQIEKETSERVAKALITARQRHIDHLRKEVNLSSFLQSACAEYDTFVQEHAQSFASASGTAASDFPSGQALEAFRKDLRARCEELLMNDIMKERQEKEEAKQEAIDDIKAQETVLAGAHTGATIKAIADKAVQEGLMNKLTPLQEQVRRLQQERKDKEKFFPPAPQPSASTLPPANQHASPIRHRVKERRDHAMRKHGEHSHTSKKLKSGQPIRRQTHTGPHGGQQSGQGSKLKHGAAASGSAYINADQPRRPSQTSRHQHEHNSSMGTKKLHAKDQSSPHAAAAAAAASHATPNSGPTNSGRAGAQSTHKRVAETTHMDQRKNRKPNQQHQA